MLAIALDLSVDISHCPHRVHRCRHPAGFAGDRTEGGHQRLLGKAFVSCLVATMDPSEDAVDARLQAQALLPASAEVSFGNRKADPEREAALGQRVIALNEPQTIHAGPGALARRLNALDFSGPERQDPHPANAARCEGWCDDRHAAWGRRCAHQDARSSRAFDRTPAHAIAGR